MLPQTKIAPYCMILLHYVPAIIKKEKKFMIMLGELLYPREERALCNAGIHPYPKSQVCVSQYTQSAASHQELRRVMHYYSGAKVCMTMPSATFGSSTEVGEESVGRDSRYFAISV